jgi:hypothetical protein
MGWEDNANSQLILDFETVYGANPSPKASIKLPFLSCDLKVDQKPQISNILGSGRKASTPTHGKKTVTGELTGEIDLVAIGYPLKMVFGAPTTTHEGAVYTHTFKIGAVTPSFLLEKGWPSLAGGSPKYYLYNGCKAGGFEIKFGGNGQLTYRIPIIGAKETFGTSPYVVTPTKNVTGPSTIFGNADVVLRQGGSLITTIEEFNYIFKNNANIGHGLNGTGQGTMAAEGGPTIEGNIKGLFDHDTIISEGRDHIKTSLSAVCGASPEQIGFYIAEQEYSQESPAITGPEGAYIALTYMGYYHDAEVVSDTYVVLINAWPSYA